MKTVLIVEDEYLIAMDLTSTLERNGWRVIGPVATVAGALRLLQDELPSVAVLDVNLGDELVTPVADALRTLSVPFAVASAYERPEQFAGMSVAGVPNVGKPAGDRRLLAVLDQLLKPAFSARADQGGQPMSREDQEPTDPGDVQITTDLDQEVKLLAERAGISPEESRALIKEAGSFEAALRRLGLGVPPPGR